MGHGLPAPELRLTRTGQTAGDIVALRSHDGFGYPEAFPLEAADVVKAKGYLLRRQRLLLPAPDGVVIVGRLVQQRRNGGVVNALCKAPAGEVVYDEGVRNDPTDDIALLLSKGAYVLAAKALPVQAQRGIMHGDSGRRQGYFLKGVVLLAPEGRAVGAVERRDISAELSREEALKFFAAAGAPALVAALMAQLVVDLPGYYAPLIPVVLSEGGYYGAAALEIGLAAVTGHMPPTVGPGHTALRLREDVRASVSQPRGRGSSWRTEDDGKPPLPRRGYYAVEEGEVEFPFLRLHEVPSELAYTYHIAAELDYTIQVLVQHSGLPLLGIVVNAKVHGSRLPLPT